MRNSRTPNAPRERGATAADDLHTRPYDRPMRDSAFFDLDASQRQRVRDTEGS